MRDALGDQVTSAIAHKRGNAMNCACLKLGTYSVHRLPCPPRINACKLNCLDWEDFARRLQTQFQRFDQLGVNYRKGIPERIGE